MKKVVLGSSLLVIIALFSYKGTKTDSEIFDIGTESVVRVYTVDGKPKGSAFITTTPTGKKVIITNEHVCRGSLYHNLQIRSLGDITIVAEAGLQDKEHDLCVFQIPQKFQDVVKPLEIGGSLDLHQQIYVVGFPLDFPLSIAKGFTLSRSVLKIGGLGGDCQDPLLLFGLFEVCFREEQLMLTNVPIYPGNSGSMGLDANGKLIGVFNSGDERTNFGNLIPLEFLNKFLGEV